MTLVELEKALATDKEMAEKFERALAGDKCKACGNDAEAFSVAAREVGLDIAPEEVERAMAEAQELDEAELKKVGGGDWSDRDSSKYLEDENGHDVWCWTGWHCYTVTLHTQAESKKVSCWSDYDCLLINIK
jgi:hypothetical protein